MIMRGKCQQKLVMFQNRDHCGIFIVLFFNTLCIWIQSSLSFNSIRKVRNILLDFKHRTMRGLKGHLDDLKESFILSVLGHCESKCLLYLKEDQQTNLGITRVFS